MSTRNLVLSVLVLVLGTCGPVVSGEPTLDELLKEYRELGLPEPPKDAKLVRYQRGDAFDAEKILPSYHLGFAISPIKKGKDVKLFSEVGKFEIQLRWRRLQEVPGVVESANDASADLLLAIHCHARGWDKLARHLYAESRKEATHSAKTELLFNAWYYWRSQLVQPHSDRAVALKRLKSLFISYPELEKYRDESLLKSCEKALVPSKAKPGSLQADLDKLVEYSVSQGNATWNGEGEEYWKIAERGFDAIPTLLLHLNDERLARSSEVSGGPGGFCVIYRRVGDISWDMLAGFSAGQLEAVPTAAIFSRDFCRVVAAKIWWDKAKEMGEEKYCLAYVLPPRKLENSVLPNEHLLRILAKKYPSRIPELLESVLENRPDVRTESLVEAVKRADLPAKTKLDLLTRVAKSDDIDRRYQALVALRGLDEKRFVELLLDSVEFLHKRVGKDIPENQAALVGLVTETDDHRAWTATENLARAAKPEFRVSVLHHIAFAGDLDFPERKSQRIRFLLKFLDDRDKVSGDGGIRLTPKEIRNAVGLYLGCLLDFEMEDKPEYTQEEWAALREKVRVAAKKELETSNK